MLLPAIAVWMATATACSPKALTADAKHAAHTAQGRVGVSATVLESHLLFSYHGGRNFPMQSVYKLPIAISALHRVEDGKLKLDQLVKVEESDLIPPAGHSPLRDKHRKGGEFTLEDLLRRAIVDSDGSASDVLLRLVGGTREVRRYLKEAGLKSIRVMHTEAQLIDDTQAQYQDSTKPDTAVELLIELQQGKLLNESNTALLLGWMRGTDTGHDRIRAKLPAGTVVADKTGSSGSYDRLTPATNDIGLVTFPDGRHMAIAIFVTDSKANTAIRNGTIAGIAEEIWDCWITP